MIVDEDSNLSIIKLPLGIVIKRISKAGCTYTLIKKDKNYIYLKLGYFIVVYEIKTLRLVSDYITKCLTEVFFKVANNVFALYEKERRYNGNVLIELVNLNCKDNLSTFIE